MLESSLATIEGLTNVPVLRTYNKIQNVLNIFNNEYSVMMKLFFLMGYSTWNLGLEDGSSGRQGRSNQLDFGPNIDFDKDLQLAPDIKFD